MNTLEFNSQSYQALLLNNIREAMVVWDLEGRITYWNPAAFILFGWTPDERIGKPVEQVYFPIFDPSIVQPGLENTGGFEVERQCKAKNGHELWVSGRTTALRETWGKREIIGYMDLARNISRMKQEQQALKESQHFVQRIVDTTPNILYIYDREVQQVIYLNPVVEMILGYPPTQILLMGQPEILDMVHPDDREKIVENSQKLAALKDGDVLEIDYRIRHQDQSWRTLHSRDTVFARSDQGTAKQIIGVAQDITEQMIMEETIQRANAQLVAQNRMAAIGELASGVAHQISNPLTTIIAEAQLLKHEVKKDESLQYSADAIEKAGWRAQLFVQQLLDFSQPKGDSFELLSINQTIQEAIIVVGDNFETNGVKLHTDLSGNLPKVRGNALQFQNLWVYLLSYARSTSPEQSGRSIIIKSYSRFPACVVVEVCQPGQIIPQEELDRLFEPGLTPSGQGTGIELSICREIVRQNQGEISVQSSEYGINFQILLSAEG